MRNDNSYANIQDLKKHGICYHCKEQLATNKLFESHSKKIHWIEQFIYFCKYGYSSDLAKSTCTVICGTAMAPPV